MNEQRRAGGRICIPLLSLLSALSHQTNKKTVFLFGIFPNTQILFYLGLEKERTEKRGDVGPESFFMKQRRRQQDFRYDFIFYICLLA